MAIVAAVAAVAAGCGSDDDAGDQGQAATTAAAAAAGAVTDDPATWGVRDKKLLGPGEFTIDLSKCPAKWSETAGITDTEIRIGQSLAQSGPNAGIANVGLGMKAYFDLVNNTEGGVAGKKLTLVQRDDGYEAARGKAAVDELIETANVFAFGGVVGTPINLAVYDKLNEECYPHLSSGTAHPAFGDPVNHPWTVPVPSSSYSTEAQIWGQYIVEKYGKGASVAALVANNDFGLSYKAAFDVFAKENGLNVKYELHDVQAASVTNEMTNLASSNADVIILMTLLNFCTFGMQYMGQSSWKPKERLISQTCNIVTYFKPAGAAADGWVSISDRLDNADPEHIKLPFIASMRDQASKLGYDPNNSLVGQGYGLYAWPLVDTLKRAAQLKGGLTRTNAILAARKVESFSPFSREGIKYSMNGAKDAFPVEGAVTVRYTLEAGKDVGANIPFGQVIDLNGKTPNCSWDGKQCRAG
ncbi:MAG: ABC transporter substrate-binding protein [Acidimicrobiales bacterium]